jgi:GNAT superfamily N-acetyltransferase
MGAMTRGRGLRPPEAISHIHDVTVFDCGKPDLNLWLQQRAHLAEGKSARTMVICEDVHVIGYYCLATGAIERESLPSAKLRRNLPDPIPVVVLGRLAIDRRHQGRGLGSALVKDAILKTIAASEIAGVRALLVHATDDQAAAFYRRYGFIASPTGPRTLLLPIETAKAALG